MSFTPAKPVISNQAGPHDDLIATIQKHLDTAFHKPISQHTQQAFERAYQRWQNQNCPPVILDSACGTAQSSLHFATQYPDHLVIGIDQSQHRIQKPNNIPDNCLLLRAECTDFWRLANRQQWQFNRHYLLYPNPWPKKKHLQRRWHGHPAFSDMVMISQSLELRTNWKVYAEEFKLALQYISQQQIDISPVGKLIPLTAFEQKYQQSNHTLWRIKTPESDTRIYHMQIRQ